MRAPGLFYALSNKHRSGDLVDAFCAFAILVIVVVVDIALEVADYEVMLNLIDLMLTLSRFIRNAASLRNSVCAHGVVAMCANCMCALWTIDLDRAISWAILERGFGVGPVSKLAKVHLESWSGSYEPIFGIPKEIFED